MIQAAKTYDVSKNIVSSKWFSKLIWDIISNLDSAVKQFNVNTGDDLVQDEADFVDEFYTFFRLLFDGLGPWPSEPQVIQTGRQSPAASIVLTLVFEKISTKPFTASI